jgi:MFS family permease
MFITLLGGTGLIVGLIGGIGESIASLLKVFSGYWSDKFERKKPFVFIGYLTSAFAKLFFTFASSPIHILILRPLERVGKGIRSAPRDAVLASSTGRGHRGRGFGIHRAMDSLGAFLGTIITFILFWYVGFDFRLILLAAGILAFFALIPILFVKEKRVEPKKSALILNLGKLSSRLKFFIAIATVFAMGNFSYMFLVLKSQEAFSGISAVGIPILLYALFQIVYSVFSVPTGILSDRIGREKVLLMGYFLFIPTCLGFVFFNSLPIFVILFILYGLMYAFVNATERAFVSDLSVKEIRGTALGVFHTSVGLGALPAGIIAGLLWDYINPTITFVYGAIMALLAALSLFYFVTKRK